MPNLPMNELRTFATVAELGFYSSGRSSGRSQPAISLQIKRLEEQLEELLFVRKGKQLVLTSAGRNY